MAEIAEKLRTDDEFVLTQDGDMYPWSELNEYCLCKCFPFVWQLIFLAVTGSFLFGFNLALLNTSIGPISSDYGWCDTPADRGCDAYTVYASFISTAVFIGAAAGSMSAGRMLPVGRRNLFMISLAVFCVGVVDSVVANSFWSLLWARLLCGFGVGIVSFICPTYLAEMSPKEKRGTYGVMHQLLITIGIFVAVLLGLAFSKPPVLGDEGYELQSDIDAWTNEDFDKIWWRVMLGLGIFPVLFCMFLLMNNYDFDTPHYYVENGRMLDASELLKRLSPGKSDSEVTAEIKEIHEAFVEGERLRAEGLSLGTALGDAKYRYVIIVGILLSAFQQLGGINVFVAASNALFADAGLGPDAVTIASTILTLVNVVMTFPSLYLIEALGRKTLLLIGCIGQTAGVAPGAIMYWIDDEGDSTTYIAVAGAIVFIIFFAVAYGPILWVYLFEIYPQEIKGAAAGAATAVNWVAGIIMVFVTAYIDVKYNYTIFAVMCGISIVIVATMMKETKGRSIDDSPYM